MSDNLSNTRLTKALFVVYLAVIVWVLLFKLGVRFSYMEGRSINLVPFSEYLFGGQQDISQVILNVAVFIPMGVYVGAISDASFGRKLIFFLLSSLFLEICQLVFRIGFFDITDIITNVLGAVIGYSLYLLFIKLFGNRERARRLINLLGAIGTVLLVTFLVLLKLRLLPFRYQ